MLENLIEKTVVLENLSKNKDQEICELQEKIVKLGQNNEILELKISHKQTELKFVNREFEILKEKFENQTRVLQNMTLMNEKLNSELMSLRNQQTKQPFPTKFYNSDLDLIRIQFSSLEAENIRKQQKIVVLESKLQNFLEKEKKASESKNSAESEVKLPKKRKKKELTKVSKTQSLKDDQIQSSFYPNKAEESNVIFDVEKLFG